MALLNSFIIFWATTVVPMMCFRDQLPYFVGSVERLSMDEWLAIYGTKIECKFKFNPINYVHTNNNTIRIETNEQNWTNSSEINDLRLRFNYAVIEENPDDQVKKTLIETPVVYSYVKYLKPGSELPITGYFLQASLQINTIDLLKLHLYSCCVESAKNSSDPQCSFIRFTRAPRSPPKAIIDTEFITQNNVLYKVILILLIATFVLLLIMFVGCIRFTDLERQMGLARNRRPSPAVRSPSSPQLFTVSVPGQASMPKLNMVSNRDLYARYNLNTSVASSVDEENECPPPPPYNHFTLSDRS